MVDPVWGAPDVVLPDPTVATTNQLFELGLDLKRTAEDFLVPPLRAFARMTSGIPTGELWYVGAFSGDGKTAFFTSLTLDLLEAGKKVYYVPTESPAKVIKCHLACKSLGYDTGDFLSDEYTKWADSEIAVQRVRAEARRLVSPAGEQQLWVADQGYLDPTMLEAHAAMAAELGVDVFVVDHADHGAGQGRSAYDINVANQDALLHVAGAYDLRVIAATQFNLDAVKGNRVLRYLAPRESYVYMGNRKRQICAGMFGLYRPLRRTGLDLKRLEAFKNGDQSVLLSELLEPNTMAIHCMKHRKYGDREGKREYVHVHHGRVQDFTGIDSEALSHGISTTQRSMR